jgi:co-chaperonin GroES (HSP10)
MKTEDILPVGDRYLIKIHRAANESASGLAMENSSNVSAAPVLGTILKSGSEAQFSEGTKILFRRYSVDELKFITSEGEQTVFMVEGSEIVATVSGSSD